MSGIEATRESISTQFANLLQQTQKWADMNQKLVSVLSQIANIDAELQCLDDANCMAGFEDFAELQGRCQIKVYNERTVLISKCDSIIKDMERILEKMALVYTNIEKYDKDENFIPFQTAPISTFLGWCLQIRNMHAKELESVQIIIDKVLTSTDRSESVYYLTMLQMEPHIDTQVIHQISSFAAAESNFLIPMISKAQS